MNNQKCSYYPQDPECNACNSRMATTPCDPNNKCIWFKHKLPQGLDPVLSNIYNGGWMCNYEPQQCVNNKLCNRMLYNGFTVNPCIPGKNIELENKILNRGTKYSRNYVNLQKR